MGGRRPKQPEAPPASAGVEQTAGAGASLDARELLAEDLEWLARILEIIRARQGLDFRGYRLGTLVRRVHNRMISVRAASLAAYTELLAADPGEAGRLVERLTIKVSAFFRNPAVFEAFRGALQERRAVAPQAPLAVWSAGCGQGEEVYSLAMLLADLGVPAAQSVVVGTDIDETALAAAARATFATDALADVPPAAREAHFTAAGASSATVTAEIRGRVRLAVHDLASAAAPPAGGPFDLVCCRNVLIYFQPPLQESVTSLLASSLAPAGLLCLGEVEWIAPALADRFEVVDRRARLFRLRGG